MCAKTRTQFVLVTRLLHADCHVSSQLNESHSRLLIKNFNLTPIHACRQLFLMSSGKLSIIFQTMEEKLDLISMETTILVHTAVFHFISRLYWESFLQGHNSSVLYSFSFSKSRTFFTFKNKMGQANIPETSTYQPWSLPPS